MKPWKPCALLLGETEQGSFHLADHLGRYGCACRFAASFADASTLLGLREFDLVLAPLRLSDGSALPLMNSLEGSRTSMFCFQPVEESCWWLPLLLQGRKCFGSSAMRPSEFMVLLKQITGGIRARAEENELTLPSPDAYRDTVIAMPRKAFSPEPLSPASARGFRVRVQVARSS